MVTPTISTLQSHLKHMTFQQPQVTYAAAGAGNDQNTDTRQLFHAPHYTTNHIT